MYGLYLEGAGWNREEACLIRQKPKQLIQDLPVLKIIPIESHRLKLQVGAHSSSRLVLSVSAVASHSSLLAAYYILYDLLVMKQNIGSLHLIWQQMLNQERLHPNLTFDHSKRESSSLLDNNLTEKICFCAYY